jgi:Uma2 family endonuclease
MALPATRHRFTVEDYHRMVEAGILAEDAPVELIEGEIVEVAPIGRRHLACVDRLTYAFVPALGERAIVRVQGSIPAGVFSEPQPDLVLLRPRADFYETSDPEPRDVLLVVEVTDTTLRYDRDVKMPLYARAGFPEAWLANVNNRQVIVHRDPSPEGYREVFEVRGRAHLSPLAFPDLVLTLDQVFGPRR